MSQLQNSSARKTALFGALETAPPRLPFWASRRRRGAARRSLASQGRQKSSIFHCRGILQPALVRLLSLLLLVATFSIQAQPLKVSVQAKSAILINAQTGAVLFEKEADALSFPASTTKIFTLLYLLEGKKVNLDTPVSVSHDAVATLHASVKQADFDRYPSYRLEHDGTIMGLKKGDVFSVHDMLHGLMLSSGNDAANALAEHCSGSVDRFMEEIGGYLKGLGFQKTRLTNPHGLQHPQHVTTARELAQFTALAMKNPIFRHIVKTSSYEAPSGLLMTQHNKLLRKGAYYYPKAIGVKTGYHAKSGYTIVAAAEDQGRMLIAVLLGNETVEQRYKGAIALFEAAFKEKRMVRTLFAKESEAFSLELPKANALLKAQLKDDLAVEYFPAEEPKLKAQLQWKQLSLPVEAGQLVGCIKVTNEQDQIVSAAPLYAISPVQKAFFYRAIDTAKYLLPWLLIGFLFLIKPLRQKLKLLIGKLFGARTSDKT